MKKKNERSFEKPVQLTERELQSIRGGGVQLPKVEGTSKDA